MVPNRCTNLYYPKMTDECLARTIRGEAELVSSRWRRWRLGRNAITVLERGRCSQTILPGGRRTVRVTGIEGHLKGGSPLGAA